MILTASVCDSTNGEPRLVTKSKQQQQQQKQKQLQKSRAKEDIENIMPLSGTVFEPLLSTLEQFLQIFSILFAVFSSFLLGLIGIPLLYYLYTTRFAFLTYLYFAWMIYDRNTCYRGSRCKQWFRNLKVWTYLADYFPIYLHKTVDLDSNRNYILGYHPHGIGAVGGITNFGTNGTGFNQIFPGLKTFGATLNLNFYIPIQRELFLINGGCSANRDTLRYILSSKNKGHVVCLAVGGAMEALDAAPGTMELTLKRRKGFVRLALETGASLVPVISFGENDIFTQVRLPEGSLLRRFQVKWKEILTFTPPIFYGRGLTIIPYKKPIHTVVGKPIAVNRTLNPSQEEIDKLHSIYIDAVAHLFYENRSKYAENPKMEIIFK